MSSKPYVGGVPDAVEEPRITELFALHGGVGSARVITDKFSRL